MNRKSLLYRIYFGTILLLLALTVSLRIVACLKDLNYTTGYFNDKALINVANAALAAAIIFAFSYIFAEERGKKFIFNFSSPLNYVFSGTLGMALLFFSGNAFGLYEKYRELAKIKLNNPFAKNALNETLISYIAFALGVLAILSVAHFILAALVTKSKDTRRADFGLITVVFLALYATYLYFNTELPINAPAKIIDQSAYLAAALFFLYETRISIGREKWRAYRAFGLIALILTAYSSIPALIVYMAKGEVISNTITETVLSFTLSLFIGARLVLTSLLREDEESKTVTLIKEAFSKRVEEISPNQEEEYDPESDEDLEGIILEDKGDYYELNFEESDDSSAKDESENEEINQNEEDTGN